MKRFNHRILSIFLLMIPGLLQAQDYEIEITADKKVIWVSKLSLPPHMTLVDYLLTLPELVDRNADTFLERFDVKLDGKVISDSKDAFLQNTFLREVEKIEINTSPSDTHIKNGISGSVNIIPIPIEKGFSADVTAEASLFTGFMPTANLRYSDGKRFEARADVNLDLYYPARLDVKETVSDTHSIYRADTTHQNYLGQLARIYAKWKISDKDVLKLWFWQNFMSASEAVGSIINTVEDKSSSLGPGWQFSTTERTTSTASDKHLAFNVLMDYSRKVKTGELKANAEYHAYLNYPGESDEFSMELKSVTNFKIPERQLKLEAAVNVNSVSNRQAVDGMLYLSPLLKLDFSGKRIKAALEGRYKGYARNFRAEGGSDYRGWYNDWAAAANMLWQIKQHHALRLKLLRSSGVASNSQVYPEMVFDGSAQLWRKGNPDLKGPTTNSANLEYITDWSKDRHRIVFNVSAEVNYQDRMITGSILFDSGKNVPYTYPTNSQDAKVAGLTAMLNYSYGPFSMSLGGNFFHNMSQSFYNRSQANYFNVRFVPSVQLKNNWFLNANYLYNSKVYKEKAVLGDCSLLSLRVCKVLKNWTLFASIQDVFDGTSTDVDEQGAETVYRTYDPYMRTVGIGASVHF